MSEAKELDTFSDALNWRTHQAIKKVSLARSLKTLQLNKNCVFPFYNCEDCSSPVKCGKLYKRAEILVLKESHLPHFE